MFITNVVSHQCSDTYIRENTGQSYRCLCMHDDVIKWKHFPRYWPFVRGIHRSPVNSPHKGWWRGALMFSLICAWTSGWINDRDAGDLKRHRAHYDVIVMYNFRRTKKHVPLKAYTQILHIYVYIYIYDRFSCCYCCYLYVHLFSCTSICDCALC